jgi:hypothetical protein
MKEINDQYIDQVLEQLDTVDDEFEKSFIEFAAKQPVIFSFLDKENMSILSEEEAEYLEYLAMVIYRSIEKVYKYMPVLTEDQLGEAEEQNWEVMESIKGTLFNDKLDAFFEGYPQEDLLAFIEDSLTEDPEDPDANMDFITDEGREPMFVALKSILDAFDKLLK